MIDKYSDEELLEMGVAKYHIEQWHNDKLIENATEMTRNDFRMIAALFGEDFDTDKEWQDDFERITESLPKIVSDLKRNKVI